MEVYIIKEAQLIFKDLNLSATISLSKFVQCRPKQWVLAGASGTNSVCVCTKPPEHGTEVSSCKD